MKILNKKQIIGVKELRNNLDNYISLVDKGESFTVVKRSRPVFRITPVDEEDQWETIVDFTKIKKGGVDIKEVIDSLVRLEKNA
ncbi:MAG: type II toxin-antitoxin system prevent-host-death family antitoxin [Patescibacteria group bacterium]|nr:type II toxin-antitoxin system prevent-host-death family antitoxin [Patescibacteria group bacterium]